MKTPLILLLTNDPKVEEAVAQALLEMGGISHLTYSAGEALDIVWGTGGNLNLAVIDCEHGPYGMRLVSAINSRREDVPMIVITGDGDKCIEALAYANGAIACLSKPVSTAQIEHAMNRYCRCQNELALNA
jgi:FixJ family two-component response regulator